MSSNQTANHPNDSHVSTSGIIRRLIQIAITILIQGSVLFLASGQITWLWAWVYIGICVAIAIANSILLMSKHPDLIAERGQINEDVKRWDRPLAGVVSLFGPLTYWIVAGLDKRFGWTQPLDLWVHITALVLTLLGNAAWSWAMLSNRFFAGLVRIQKERGHHVASSGPYKTIRHPGYASLIVWSFTIPLMLGSLWALIPGGLTALTAIIRTAMEDKTLREELPGYAEYAQQTRYRLIPGIW